MPDIKSILSTPGSSFKAPARFPAGNYVVMITSYDTLPFHWKKSGTNGLSYVPTIKPISCVEADDDDNPELQKEQQDLLEKFGDWTNKEFQFAYTSRDTNERCAGVSEINFPLIELDDSGEAVGILEKFVWRFYLRDGQEEQGFLHDVLGMSFPEGTELGDMLEATVGKKFMVSFIYEANPNDPTRPPNLTVESMTSV